MHGVILRRLSHNVTIFERSPSSLLQTQGAGIVAGGETQAFFSKHDRTHTPIAVVSGLRHYLNHEGKEIDRQDREQKMTSWDLLYNVLRANFDGGGDKAYVRGQVIGRSEGEGEARYEVDRIVTGVQEGEDGKLEVEYHTHADKANVQTATADLVIAADGAGSTIRDQFRKVERQYAGYVAWRGTVPEAEVSGDVADAFVEKFTFYHAHLKDAKGTQILSYVIPGPRGSLQKGERLVNWVWYCNYAADSAEWTDLMTDVHGKVNKTTLHAGKMRPLIWESQQGYAHAVLPPQFAELVDKTKEPFVQAITDSLLEGDSNCFSNRKIICVGDAVAGFRPHTAASTTQAARQALMLDDVLRGSMSWEEFEKETMEYGREVQKSGIEMGDRSQFGKHPLAS